MSLDYSKCPNCGAAKAKEQSTLSLHSYSILYNCSNKECYKNLGRLEMTNKLIEEIIMSVDKVLINFRATWCASCIMMVPELKQIEESCIAVIDIDADKYPDLIVEYNVTSLPTMFCYKDGRLVNTINGVVSKKIIEENFK